MNEWTEIRRKVLIEGVSKRSIVKDYKIGWDTLDKMLSNVEPPGYQFKRKRTRPKMGPVMEVIDHILDADKLAPPKQRHTGRRIFERLRDEYDYKGSIYPVRRYIALKKRHTAEVFVPLIHPPGHSQYDFGFAKVYIAGVLCDVALSVASLPFSDTFHVSAYPKECTETFQAGHVAAFDFFGGVPIRTDYDNSRIAVKKVVGPSMRELTSEFLRLESHFLFAHHFCNVARGNEKGHVEGLVAYARNNMLVPVPHFDSFADLNHYLEACCFADLTRRVRGKPQTKAELLGIDRAALLPIPKERFEARRIVKTKSSSLSLVRFDCNDYSVPTSFAHHDVTAAGDIDEIKISVGTEVIAIHKRCWDKEATIFDPCHYLALLERKPGAFDYAKPLEHWELPRCFSVLRARLEAEFGSKGTREYIQVLRFLENYTLGQLRRAVEEALAMGTTNHGAIGLIVRGKLEEPVAMFSLDGHPHLQSFSIEPLNLGAYGTLTAKGA